MFYHCTHRKNLAGIVEKGLLTLYSNGKDKRVWMVEYDQILWAERHAAIRHEWSASDMVVVAIAVPPDHVFGSGHDGVYYTRSDIGPENIMRYFCVHFVPVGLNGLPASMTHTVEKEKK